MKKVTFILKIAALLTLALTSCEKTVPAGFNRESTEPENNNPPGKPICLSRTIVLNATTPMPHPRYWTQTASAGNDIAFFSGDDISGSFHGVDIYNVSTNTWSSKAFSEKTDNAGVAACNSKIASGGGSPDLDGGLDIVNMLDVPSGTWSTAHLSIGRYLLGAAGYGNKLLFAGGLSSTTTVNMQSRVDIYDAASNAWSVAELSEARLLPAGASANNIIGFGGGMDAGNAPRATVDLYNTSTGAWTHTVLSSPRARLAGIGAGDLLFFAGGYKDRQGTHSKVCDIYNTTTQTWSHLNLAHVSGILVTAMLGTKVLFIDPDTGMSDYYDICSGGWGSMQFSTPSAHLTAAGSVGGKLLIGSSKMGIYGVGPLYNF